MAMQAAMPLAAVSRYDTSNMTAASMTVDSQRKHQRIPVVSHVITDSDMALLQVGFCLILVTVHVFLSVLCHSRENVIKYCTFLFAIVL